jgi:hypothetical protein
MAVPTRPTTDPEVAGRFPVPNPYTGPGPSRSFGDTAVDALKRLIFLGISLFFLLEKFNVYRTTLQSPHISHEWFKIGLGTTVGKVDVFFVTTFANCEGPGPGLHG